MKMTKIPHCEADLGSFVFQIIGRDKVVKSHYGSLINANMTRTRQEKMIYVEESKQVTDE